jgi:hypothetical protein
MKRRGSGPCVFCFVDTFDVAFVDSKCGKTQGPVIVNVAAATTAEAGILAVNPPQPSA